MIKPMNDNLSRRRFLKYSLVTASAFIATSVVITIDKKKGFVLGRSKFNVGLSEANGQCGASYDCAGGGGKCGASYDCAGQ